jgi:hypothetical protein
MKYDWSSLGKKIQEMSLSLLSNTFLQMIEFMCSKVYIVRVVNMYVLIHKIDVQHGKVNDEHYVS